MKINDFDENSMTIDEFARETLPRQIFVPVGAPPWVMQHNFAEHFAPAKLAGGVDFVFSRCATRVRCRVPVPSIPLLKLGK